MAAERSELDAFLQRLGAVLDSRTAEGKTHDAIDAAIAAPARTSGVTSLRDAPEVEAFRRELVDGMVRADTVNQLLRFAGTLLSRLVV